MTFGCYSQVTNNLLVLDYTTEWWLMTQKDIMTYVMEVWSWPWPRISTWYSWALLTFYDSWGPTQCAGFIRFCWWLLQPAKADKVHGYAGLVVTHHAGSSRCFRGICLSPLILGSHLLLWSLLSQMCWPFSQEELITQMQPRHKAHGKEEQGPSWVWVMFSEIKSFKRKQKDNLVSGFLTASMEERGWEHTYFRACLSHPLVKPAPLAGRYHFVPSVFPASLLKMGKVCKKGVQGARAPLVPWVHSSLLAVLRI